MKTMLARNVKLTSLLNSISMVSMERLNAFNGLSESRGDSPLKRSLLTFNSLICLQINCLQINCFNKNQHK